MSPSSPDVDYFTFNYVDFEVSVKTLRLKSPLSLMGPIDLELK